MTCPLCGAELAEARGPLPDHFPPRVEVLRLCPASGMTLREALEEAAEDSATERLDSDA